MADDPAGKPLLDVLKKRQPDRRPIWFMRQAGRYLPEYIEVRRKAGSFLDLCYSPALAAEVTLQPLRRYDLDAAIIFADILVVPHAMGLKVEFVENEGPSVQLVECAADVERLSGLKDSAQIQAVCESIGRVRNEIANHQVVIGFCGAPWTVASYMVEGRSSERLRAKLAVLRKEKWFDGLIQRLVEESIVYLKAQIRAGVEVLQIFDSWAGDVPVDHRDRVVVEPIRQIVEGVRAEHPDVPVIAFPRGLGAGHIDAAGRLGVEAVSVESETRLADVAGLIEAGCAVQGNLDPIALLAGSEIAKEAASAVLRQVPAHRHIFNLGHGIRQQTDPHVVADVVSHIRMQDRDISIG